MISIKKSVDLIFCLQEKTQVSQSSSRFAKGEFRESDYESDYDGSRISSLWKPQTSAQTLSDTKSSSSSIKSVKSSFSSSGSLKSRTKRYFFFWGECPSHLINNKYDKNIHALCILLKSWMYKRSLIDIRMYIFVIYKNYA